MATHTREENGRLVEYRRHPWHPTVLHVEARVLQPDGTPHDDRWYPVSDEGFLNLQRRGSDILDVLASEAAPVAE